MNEITKALAKLGYVDIYESSPSNIKVETPLEEYGGPELAFNIRIGLNDHLKLAGKFTVYYEMHEGNATELETQTMLFDASELKILDENGWDLAPGHKEKMKQTVRDWFWSD